MSKATFLYTACTVLILVSLFSEGLVLVEFVSGNGDGIWMDMDIRNVAFHLVGVLSLFFFILYFLLFGRSFIQNILISVLTTVFLVWGLEQLSCCILYLKKKNPVPAPVISTPFLRPDYTESFVKSDTLGLRAKPNWSLGWVPVKDGIAYDSVFISIDSLSRRSTPRLDTFARDKYAVFLGCSFTYGDGVTNCQTLPAHFQRYAKDYSAYNYGFLAYSPLHMLSLLEHTPIREAVPEKEGIAIYTMIYDHLDRVVPALRWIDMTDGNFPYLDSKTFTTQGVFSEKRRFYTYLVKKFQRTGIKELFNINYPQTHTEDHFRLLTTIITRSREEYEKQFGANRFYVMVFPGSKLPGALMHMLKEANLQILDYSELLNIEDKMLPFDSSHPSGELYEAVAMQLAKDLVGL